MIEYGAALASLLCVWLTVRQNVWCWPVGIVGTVLYTWVFLHAKLYSDTGLQVIFTVLQFYGWWLWVRGGRREDGAAASAPTASPLRVTRLKGPAILRWLGTILAGTFLLGHQMAVRTDAALPYVDAFQTVMSLAAQYLMGFKILESWVLWILVDIVSVGMYFWKGLYVTTGLYAIFLVMAAMGWHAWYREVAHCAPDADSEDGDAGRSLTPLDAEDANEPG